MAGLSIETRKSSLWKSLILISTTRLPRPRDSSRCTVSRSRYLLCLFQVTPQLKNPCPGPGQYILSRKFSSRSASAEPEGGPFAGLLSVWPCLLTEPSCIDFGQCRSSSISNHPQTCASRLYANTLLRTVWLWFQTGSEPPSMSGVERFCSRKLNPSLFPIRRLRSMRQYGELDMLIPALAPQADGVNANPLPTITLSWAWRL